MRKTLGMALLTVLLLTASAAAFNYYYADNDSYWLLDDKVVGYQVLIPSKGHLYKENARFGERTLELVIRENGPTLTLGGIKGTGLTVETVRKSLADYWNRLLSGVKVVDSRSLTTSSGVAATFHAFTGISPSGQTVMVRIILYQRGKDIAYITYTLEDKEYTGDLQQYWLQAVNSFKWN